MKDFRTTINAFLFEQPDVHHPAIHISLLLSRIYAGYTIMSAGLDKLPLPDWMVDQVVAIGFPFPTFFAWIACFTEFAFGLLLILGLLTRLSGLMLAITMGFAAFGFQQIRPLADMHIAQHFFWMFILYSTLGGGKYSLDYIIRKPGTPANSRWAFITVPMLAALLGTAFWLEFTAPAPATEESDVVVSSVNIPGSFNNWDPTSNTMTQISDTRYELDIAFQQAGVIEFKFTLNQSWDTNLGTPEPSVAMFPLAGIATVDTGNTTQNIRAYIPASGQYRFTLNRETYAYSLDSLASR